MRHPQIQFIDFNPALETYVCQFAERTDPRVTARFTAMTLPEIKIIALTFAKWVYDASDSEFMPSSYSEQVDRIGDMCNRIAARELARDSAH